MRDIEVIVHLVDPPNQLDASKMPQRTAWKSDERTGEHVWPFYVETCLVEALEAYADHLSSRRKSKKPKIPESRDKYLSDYILQKTGVIRTAKQISSRLQQIYNYGKNPYLKDLIRDVSPRRRGRVPKSSEKVWDSAAIPADQSTSASQSTQASRVASPCTHHQNMHVEEVIGHYPVAPIAHTMAVTDHNSQLAQVTIPPTSDYGWHHDVDSNLFNPWINGPYQDLNLFDPSLSLGTVSAPNNLYAGVTEDFAASSYHHRTLGVGPAWNNDMPIFGVAYQDDAQYTSSSHVVFGQGARPQPTSHYLHYPG